jgi:hypothetical protein
VVFHRCKPETELARMVARILRARRGVESHPKSSRSVILTQKISLGSSPHHRSAPFRIDVDREPRIGRASPAQPDTGQGGGCAGGVQKYSPEIQSHLRKTDTMAQSLVNVRPSDDVYVVVPDLCALAVSDDSVHRSLVGGKIRAPYHSLQCCVPSIRQTAHNEVT